MWNEFLDEPAFVDDYLNRLDRHDKNIFKKGYIASLHKLVEQISDSKYKISSKLLGDISETQRIELESRIALLDIYEDHYGELAATMQLDTELQP